MLRRFVQIYYRRRVEWDCTSLPNLGELTPSGVVFAMIR